MFRRQSLYNKYGIVGVIGSLEDQTLLDIATAKRYGERVWHWRLGDW